MNKAPVLARFTAKQILTWGYAALWAITLVGLPFTSLPALGKLTGGAMVAPLSAIPLALLVAAWLIPYLLRRGRLPRESVPLVVFLIASVAISAAALFLNVIYIKDKTMLPQELRAFIPLLIGLAFYFAVAAWPTDDRTLRRMLQAIHIGGALTVAWALLQAVFVTFYHSQYPALFTQIRDLLVIQRWGVIAGSRITGLTYEPSWFDHQLNMLYLPLWLAATFQRSSVFRWRVLWLSFENILLGLGLVAFFLSWPRIGAIALLLMLAFLVIKFLFAVYQKAVQFITRRWLKRPASLGWARLLAGTGMLAALAVFCLLFVGLYLQLGSRRDARLTLITQASLSPEEVKIITRLDENSLLYVANRLAFMERAAYWVTGWHIFNDYPIAGVGIGNAGFFFFPRMPAIAWGSNEINKLVSTDTSLPNIKSFWVRLLAETGIIGFALFASWYFLLWRSARASQRSRSPAIQMIALAGQLALVAFLVEGFSIDSFGLPYLWVMAGLVSASGAIIRRQVE